MPTHYWNRDSREFEIIQEIFDSCYPDWFWDAERVKANDDGIREVFPDEPEEWPIQQISVVKEMHWMGFLFAWEFLRGIHPEQQFNASWKGLLREITDLSPPEYDGEG